MSSKIGCGMVVAAIMGIVTLAFSVVAGVIILLSVGIWMLARLGSNPRNPDGTRKKSASLIDGE